MEQEELARAVVAKYEEETAIYEQLLALAGRVKTHLLAGEVELVQGLLGEQARLVAVIDRCGQESEPLRRRLAGDFGYPDLTLGLLSKLTEPKPPLARVAGAMRKVARLLRELNAIHGENQRLLEERLGAVRAERANLARGKNAVQAYRAPVAGESRFVDRRS